MLDHIGHRNDNRYLSNMIVVGDHPWCELNTSHWTKAKAPWPRYYTCTRTNVRLLTSVCVGGKMSPRKQYPHGHVHTTTIIVILYSYDVHSVVVQINRNTCNRPQETIITCEHTAHFYKEGTNTEYIFH